MSEDSTNSDMTLTGNHTHPAWALEKFGRRTSTVGYQAHLTLDPELDGELMPKEDSNPARKESKYCCIWRIDQGLKSKWSEIWLSGPTKWRRFCWKP